MEKVTKQKIIQKPIVIDFEAYITKDGREFENEQDAIAHENVNGVTKRNVNSSIINHGYSLHPFKFVKFENELQVEAYEQKMSGNKDNNTWMSWVSCKEKFNKFPCWMLCKYIKHFHDGSFTAIYLTPEEARYDLLDVIKQIEKLKEL